MIIYTDVFCGDELLSDAYDIKEIDDVVYEVDCSMVQVKAGADVDIGANASAEEADEALEDGVEIVNNVVYSLRLQSTSFDKKSYMTYIKGYMKAVKAHLQEKNPDRIAAFEKGAATFVKKVLSNFNDYEFYTGESMNPDGMVVLLNYREDGVTPYLSYFKDALAQTKV
ncbi:Translationally-controlled tumor protein [Saitoella coloradoensis]